MIFSQIVFTLLFPPFFRLLLLPLLLLPFLLLFLHSASSSSSSVLSPPPPRLPLSQFFPIPLFLFLLLLFSSPSLTLKVLPARLSLRSCGAAGTAGAPLPPQPPPPLPPWPKREEGASPLFLPGEEASRGGAEAATSEEVDKERQNFGFSQSY